MVLSSRAFAQKMDEFDLFFADLGILQDKSVQGEIGLTEAQRARMNEHASWMNAQRDAIAKQANEKKLDPKQANAQLASVMETLKVKVMGELTAAQLKRVREITLQRDGLLPLLSQRVGERIGLTSAQTQTLREGFLKNDESAKRIQRDAFEPILKKYDAMRPKNAEEEKKLRAQANKELDAAKQKIAPELTRLSKEYQDFVKKTLSKGQFDAFVALKGKAFTPKSA